MKEKRTSTTAGPEFEVEKNGLGVRWKEGVRVHGAPELWQTSKNEHELARKVALGLV